MDAKILRRVALGLAAVALAGTVAGFFAAWERTHGAMPAFGGFNGMGATPGGEMDIRYSLREVTLASPYGNDRDTYDGVSDGLRQTFLVQSIVVWCATALGLASVALLVASLWLDAPWLRGAGVVALALLALVSLAGAGLFMNNFPNTKEGDAGDDGSFWGSKEGFTWGPGLAWWAEVDAGLSALLAAVAAWLSIRAGSAASASTALL